MVQDTRGMWHINAEGKAEQCQAYIRACPFGAHWETQQEAIDAFNGSMKKKGLFKSLRSKKQPETPVALDSLQGMSEDQIIDLFLNGQPSVNQALEFILNSEARPEPGAFQPAKPYSFEDKARTDRIAVSRTNQIAVCSSIFDRYPENGLTIGDLDQILVELNEIDNNNLKLGKEQSIAVDRVVESGKFSLKDWSELSPAAASVVMRRIDRDGLLLTFYSCQPMVTAESEMAFLQSLVKNTFPQDFMVRNCQFEQTALLLYYGDRDERLNANEELWADRNETTSQRIDKFQKERELYYQYSDYEDMKEDKEDAKQIFKKKKKNLEEDQKKHRIGHVPSYTERILGFTHGVLPLYSAHQTRKDEEPQPYERTDGLYPSKLARKGLNCISGWKISRTITDEQKEYLKSRFTIIQGADMLLQKERNGQLDDVFKENCHKIRCNDPTYVTDSELDHAQYGMRIQTTNPYLYEKDIHTIDAKKLEEQGISQDWYNLANHLVGPDRPETIWQEQNMTSKYWVPPYVYDKGYDSFKPPSATQERMRQFQNETGLTDRVNWAEWDETRFTDWSKLNTYDPETGEVRAFTDEEAQEFRDFCLGARPKNFTYDGEFHGDVDFSF